MSVKTLNKRESAARPPCRKADWSINANKAVWPQTRIIFGPFPHSAQSPTWWCHAQAHKYAVAHKKFGLDLSSNGVLVKAFMSLVSLQSKDASQASNQGYAKKWLIVNSVIDITVRNFFTAMAYSSNLWRYRNLVYALHSTTCDVTADT